MAYTPYSYVQLKADGATTNFPFNFPYLDTAHIQVSVDTVVTDFTWVDSYTIKIASAPVAGAVVEIRRITPKDSAIVSFQDGSTLLEADLDLMVTYNLYCAQEAYDGTQASIHLTADGVWDGQGVRATDFADPTDAQDLVTLNYLNNGFIARMNAIEQDAINQTGALQGAAKASESSAAESESAAAASRTAAAASQDAAKLSETNAAASEKQAAGYAAGLNLPSASGEALRVLRQNGTETGLEYGPAVQTDVLDATIGALLSVGAFGLGSPDGLPLLADIDLQSTPPGIYKWQLGTGTAPSSYGVVIVASHNGNTSANNWAYQMFFSTDGYVAWRNAINLASWSGWHKIYDTANFDPASYEPLLGYVPVQSGTGVSQLSNVVKIGWTGTNLRATVDTLDIGDFLYDANWQAKIGAQPIGSVGSYAFLYNNGTAHILPGDTVDGSLLIYTDTNKDNGNTAASLVPPGTWRAMGYGAKSVVSVYQRVS